MGLLKTDFNTWEAICDWRIVKLDYCALCGLCGLIKEEWKTFSVELMQRIEELCLKLSRRQNYQKVQFTYYYFTQKATSSSIRFRNNNCFYKTESSFVSGASQWNFSFPTNQRPFTNFNIDVNSS